MIIEIEPNEPRANVVEATAAELLDLDDCTGPGDAEPACRYVLDTIKPAFHIIARNSAGDYENRPATDDEIQATAEAIYFDSDTDFSDTDNAALYLIWEAANTDRL